MIDKVRLPSRNPEDYCTLGAAVELLGMNKRSVRTRVERGQITAYRVEQVVPENVRHLFPANFHYALYVPELLEKAEGFRNRKPCTRQKWLTKWDRWLKVRRETIASLKRDSNGRLLPRQSKLSD